KSIALVTTSMRTPRVGPNVAAFIKTILDPLATASDLTIAPVDLADFKLPIYDEAVIPAMVVPGAADGPQFAHAHTLAWTSEIAKHAGYVLVIPEYNYGVSGGTKNAIDYLVHEWTGKPVVVVSYGVKGGAFASEQVSHVLGHMKLKVAPTKPQLAFAGGQGPEMFGAMLKGELGEETKKEWLGKKGEVEQAFGELKAFLE
ncbi:flavoprotein-like protein, partial [Lasiosphaeris hirsuta]